MNTIVVKNQVRTLSYVRRQPDKRDIKYSAKAAGDKGPAPSTENNLIAKFPSVWDQGQYSSCVWHSLGALKMAADMRYLGDKAKQPSFDFGYYASRVKDGDPGQDCGTDNRTGCQILLDVGVCDAELWPYNQHDLYAAPPKACYQNAATRKIDAFYWLQSRRQFLTCLAAGYGFSFGLDCPTQLQDENFDGFLGEDIKLSDKIPNGGHDLTCVGSHEDENGELWYLIRNSWGLIFGLTEPGFEGHFWMHSSIMESTDWCSDQVTIRLAHEKGMAS